MPAVCSNMAFVALHRFFKFLCIFVFLLLMLMKVCAGTQTNLTAVSVLHNVKVISANSQEFYKFLIRFTGNDFNSDLSVRPVSYFGEKGSECLPLNASGEYSTSIVWSNSTEALVNIWFPIDSPLLGKDSIYLCFKSVVRTTNTHVPSTFRGEVIKWIHQGDCVVFGTRHSGVNSVDGSSEQHVKHKNGLQSRWSVPKRSKRQTNWTVSSDHPPDEGTPVVTGASGLQMNGMRVESADKDPTYGDDGVVELLLQTNALLRLFGTGFSNSTLVTVTARPGRRLEVCEFPTGDVYRLENDSLTEFSALIKFEVPAMGGPGTNFYFCLKDERGGVTMASVPWVHQGTQSWLAIRTYDKLLPLWASICIILMCLAFSALFSGLNLGLMSMDQTDLKVISNTGSETERRYARAIMPVRKKGNYLLCSILLGNVLVNSSLTIIMDDITSGLVAVIGSTLAIVIFGEISPQAICSRHGLAIGANTIIITKIVMIITFPLAYPISLFLDFLLGAELGNIYTRERLKELVKLTTEYNDLEKDEVNIISGALELRKKTVKEVMTRLEDIFMLDYNSVLDFETVSEIMKQGYSRIPVYEGSHSNIVTVLYIKDLAFVDPDDNTPLKTLCKFYQNPCNFVFEDMTLDIMFKQFKEGIKGHMAFVHRVNSEGEGDPFYETVGLITLEDVIEELIQAEIVDETDVWTDNRSKRRRNEKSLKQDFTVFAERRENQTIHISPQLTLAMFQYLNTNVDAFKPETISETILRRLLKQDVLYHIKVKNKEKARHDPATLIYTQGKAVDYFVLIVEGRVEVMVGRECLEFESGPFTYFGTQALTQNIGVAESPTATPANIGSLQSVNLDTILRHTFVPDYTVRAITEVFYIRIKRSLYLAAKRATLMERARKTSQSQTDDHFDDEVEKLLHSLEDDERSQGPNDPPTLSTTARDDRDYQSEKESLNRAIAAAERSPGGLSNDITALVSSMSPRGASSPASVGGSPGLVLNPNGKLGVPRSPGKSPSKQTPSPKETTGSTEERTVLLPKGQS